MLAALPPLLASDLREKWKNVFFLALPNEKHMNHFEKLNFFSILSHYVRYNNVHVYWLVRNLI